MAHDPTPDRHARGTRFPLLAGSPTDWKTAAQTPVKRRRPGRDTNATAPSKFFVAN